MSAHLLHNAKAQYLIVLCSCDKVQGKKAQKSANEGYIYRVYGLCPECPQCPELTDSVEKVTNSKHFPTQEEYILIMQPKINIYTKSPNENLLLPEVRYCVYICKYVNTSHTQLIQIYDQRDPEHYMN